MSDKMITFEGNGPEIERVRYDNMVLRAEIKRLKAALRDAIEEMEGNMRMPMNAGLSCPALGTARAALGKP